MYTTKLTRRLGGWLLLVAGFTAQSLGQATTSQPSDPVAEPVTLEDAEFACPMETHPDETDPTRQGAYFAAKAGDCPWCGMKLKPVTELAWVEARKAAQGGEVAYTCPQHPHVFSRAGAKCPRCDRELSPFKVMYTCPDPRHASVVRAEPGTCPHDQRKLTPFRGIWLAPEMANHNVPSDPHVAESAAYRCPLHPLVHSDEPGDCTICARALEATGGGSGVAQSAKPPARNFPAGAKYVCPMEECWHFAAEPGRCPECGMRTEPIDELAWAAALRNQRPATTPSGYVCPMHVDRVRTAGPGTCPVCGMQLVKADTIREPASAPAAIAAQMNYLMEHYLALQRQFSSDRSEDVTLHALGLVGAADEIIKHLGDAGVELPDDFGRAARSLRGAALKLTGKSLDDDRVTFVGLSDAMRALVAHVRPSNQQYPTLYIFYCPMTKGDWIQTSDELANPFYGFKMLKCGELQATR